MEKMYMEEAPACLVCDANIGEFCGYMVFDVPNSTLKSTV